MRSSDSRYPAGSGSGLRVLRRQPDLEPFPDPLSLNGASVELARARERGMGHDRFSEGVSRSPD